MDREDKAMSGIGKVDSCVDRELLEWIGKIKQ